MANIRVLLACCGLALCLVLASLDSVTVFVY